MVEEPPVAIDTDADGLTDDYEIGVSGTNENLYDSDDDGVGDGDEINYGTNPLVPDSAGGGGDSGGGAVDSDGDALIDDDETFFGTDPYMYDTDGDGVSDADEINAGTDPLDPSSLP